MTYWLGGVRAAPMSTWCRTGRHGECEDTACNCACHLRYLETSAEMVARCAARQDAGLPPFSDDLRPVQGRGDAMEPTDAVFISPSDQGIEGVRRLDDQI